MTIAASIFMFAAIFALTAPPAPSQPAVAAVSIPAEIYADCDAVRAAGAAPLRMGQPGYRAALDGNMNGVACETVGTSSASIAATQTPSPAPVTQPTEPVQEAAPPPPPPPPVPPSSEMDPGPRKNSYR
ncbi:excalibur calcium-binding domain-containing protein [Sphingomonas aliaeris]|uniref:Excalibur calcium-binding domain-containing protein n=2 Tax=Sphingomonas aliaeris TaxID=2759526 RepID=A0A974NSE9_9SPHN|nr:excalibur calcium-binding domain-containing protein [Sphingomonas aliaeris]